MESPEMPNEERQGWIIECQGHRARVRVEPAPGCPRCASGEGCGQGVIGAMRGGAGPVDFWVTVPEGESVSTGDAIMLTIAPSALMAGSALLYLLPLAGLVLGALLAQVLAVGGEAVISLAGAAGLIGGFLLSRAWLGRAGQSGGFEPIFLRTVPVSNREVT